MTVTPQAGADVAPRDWNQHPPYLSPAYQSTILRSPRKPLIPVKQSLLTRSGPVFGHDSVGELDNDLTKNGRNNGEPLGERIIVTGRVLDEDGRPVPNTLLEIWQANAAGRYVHRWDQHDAPLDPNFFGAGRCMTDDQGRYRFTSIKPGAYPWGNHHNAWRPAHIHFSLFGPSYLTRLVTQMYFPGDPLLPLDPIYNGIPEGARDLLISRFSIDVTEPVWALGYEFDIVLRGRKATPMEA
ncbi:protocatechuate 3,4-dioxygenase subunit beta [Azospirillum griseum]|uniref:Protocatechuate 3,4-dioxygenase subunit beta n=1 Tax=Azospirillum griseum TaxID=2496639 RepID=A0A431VGX5_9PROT|nr:protocatechuate 3,4-dioxygenase subunit beta [Azospirillum griseum]RTR20153.1 protocatechuate 3,4-dioxygenase subunit beta [Azospirillum griseum]